MSSGHRPGLDLPHNLIMRCLFMFVKTMCSCVVAVDTPPFLFFFLFRLFSIYASLSVVALFCVVYLFYYAVYYLFMYLYFCLRLIAVDWVGGGRGMFCKLLCDKNNKKECENQGSVTLGKISPCVSPLPVLCVTRCPHSAAEQRPPG